MVLNKCTLFMWVLVSLTDTDSGEANISFEYQMEQAAMHIASGLRLTPFTQSTFLTVTSDQNYLLPCSNLLLSLQNHLRTYTKNVTFHPIDSKILIEKSTQIQSISDNSTKYVHDSLQLLIYYFLRDSKDKCNFSIAIKNKGQYSIFQSQEYTLLASNVPAGIQREIFDNIKDEYTYEELLFCGRVTEKLRTVFGNPDYHLLDPPRHYQLIMKHSNPIAWQVDKLKELLNVRFNIQLIDTNCSQTITIEPTGFLTIRADSSQYTLGQVLSKNSLFDLVKTKNIDSLHYLYETDAQSTHSFETKAITSTQEKTIRSTIQKVLTEYYPQQFSDFNLEAISQLFADLPFPSILTGTLVQSNPRTGLENVIYTWKTKKQWLLDLSTMSQQKHKKFSIQTKVLGLYSDNLSPYRYWAIVVQQWNTADATGNISYSDNGFLIVNFDFNPNLSLSQFKIYYRLWFYDYQYDQKEVGMTRYSKIARDIRYYFQSGCTGIDSRLKQNMTELILSKIKSTSL